MYKVIMDSCGELTEEMKQSGHFVNVPLTLTLDGEDIIDDETFDRTAFLKKVAESPNCPASSCPSPDAFLQEMKCDADRIYVITMSANISGTYNSANLARDILLEDKPDANIYIIDSKTASVGETLIALLISDLEEEGLPFDEICEQAEEFVKVENSFFVVEDLEALEKNGRLSHITAKIASTLKIKPVLGATDDGYIKMAGQARGMNKAIERMVALMMEVTKECEKRRVAICHCNALERAKQLKAAVESVANFKEIFILETSGTATMYVNNGGLIMVV